MFVSRPSGRCCYAKLQNPDVIDVLQKFQSTFFAEFDFSIFVFHGVSLHRAKDAESPGIEEVQEESLLHGPLVFSVCDPREQKQSNLKHMQSGVTLHSQVEEIYNCLKDLFG